MHRPPLYLYDIDYTLGDLIPLQDLSLSCDEASRLVGHGLRTISRLNRDLAEVIADHVARHASPDLCPDLVLCATNSLSPAMIESTIREIARRGVAGGLPIQFVTGGDCTNLHHVLRQAIAHIHSGFSREVLIVTADRGRDAVGEEIRAVFGGGLVGDAVASCRVGHRSGGFRLTGAPVTIRSAEQALDRAPTLGQMLASLRKATRAVMPNREQAATVVQVIPNT